MNQSRLRFSFPRCQICNKSFDSYYHMPRVVPTCGHTFCEKCIKLKLHPKANRMVFTCPECATQVVIRRTVADELPRNITIIELIKNNKVQAEQEPQQLHSSGLSCSLHHKKIDMVCLTCGNSKICSHCAVFGSHKGHEIVSEDTASKDDRKELNQFIEVIEDTIEMMVLPESPNNLERKAKEDLSTQLKQQIRGIFKNYYEQVKRRQQEWLSQCENISLSSSNGDNIDQILENFDAIRKRSDQIGLGATRSQVDSLMEEARSLHSSIESVVQAYTDSVSNFVQKAKQKMKNTAFLRIHPTEARSLNAIFSDTTSSSSLQKEPTLARKQSELSKKDVTAYKKPPQQRQSTAKSKIVKNHETVGTTEFDEEQNKSKNMGPLKGRPSALGIGSSRAHLNKTEKSSIECIETLHVESKDKRNANQRSNRKEAVKTDRSPIKDLNSIDLKYEKPMKELNYELRPKLQNIINEIDRQKQGGTLELIGLDIKDDLIKHICEYLRIHKLKYSMIKLVKNGLTDEGLRLLLSYLALDDFVKVLNVTNNHLTNKSLKVIEEFINSNSILKTFYVSNNKITPIQLKKLQPCFDSKFVQVIL